LIFVPIQFSKTKFYCRENIYEERDSCQDIFLQIFILSLLGRI
jgi:hypothetical protein